MHALKPADGKELAKAWRLMKMVSLLPGGRQAWAMMVAAEQAAKKLREQHPKGSAGSHEYDNLIAFFGC